MTQPFFLFMNNAAFAALQVNTQQTAARAFMEEVVENLPVVKWRPVAFGDLNADQFAAVAVGDPGTVSDPLIRDAVDLTLLEG